jgi:hypothetical protein
MSGRPFNKLSRREFVGLTLGGLVLAACGGKSASPINIPGKLLSTGSELGHMFRDNKFPAPSRTEKHRVVVIGGGISGLSACRKLSQNGINDFVLLELENELGGNSVSGKNEICSFPWAAHYLPLPNKGLPELNQFLEEAEIIKGYDAAGLPVIEETYLCFAPHERLFINGVWQDDITPEYGVPPVDRSEIVAFMKLMDGYRNQTGSDGKPAFAIPVEDSSADETLRALDKISMAEFIKQHNWSSPYLTWYLDYCCSDDYGTSIAFTSAWAGIHYFASRRGAAANAETGSVITWPEGNAFLAEKLRLHSENRSRKGHAVFKMDAGKTETVISCYDSIKKESYTIVADRVICATPQFVRERLLQQPVSGPTYSPWVVANLSVTDWPGGNGQPLSWDNVIYNSKSLGYVDATHQLIRADVKRRVLTFYFPFTDALPNEARKLLRSMTHEQLTKLVMDEIAKAHPEAHLSVNNIDIRIWGHAMIRPVKNYIWGEERQKLKTPLNGTIFFAHSDLSGISIFEEAFYQGIRAAEELTASLK